MLTLQEISDRLEIQDLITRYVYAIDERDYETLDNVFTPDAVIDYTELGGSKGTREETKQFLGQSMPGFPAFQHLSVNTKLAIDGDTAHAKTILFNPMMMDHEGEKRMFFIGLWYIDELVRTADGWRIKHRREQKCWDYNAPAGLLPE